MESCTHPRTEIRRRTIAGGNVILTRQCLDCGAAASNAISQRTMTKEQREAPPPWDVALEQKRDVDYKAGAAERAEERDREWREKRICYAEYRRTPAWISRRELVMERDNHWCQGCHQQPAKEVHHLTYKHIFEEFLFELVALCPACHDRWHGQEGERPLWLP